jgi:hypothetical protein
MHRTRSRSRTSARARSGHVIVSYATRDDAYNGEVFVAKGRQISRPFALAAGDAVHLAWKEFDGERTTIEVMTSSDEGETWSPPRSVAETWGTSDHPLLVSNAKAVFLSWLTQAEGYRLVPLNVP